MRTGQTKTPDRSMRKKLILLSGNEKRTRQGHHQKANTQNINIYNIIHNDHDAGDYPRDPKPYVYVTSTFEKTYDTPLRLAKAAVKSEHDLMLERELRAYKGEVETKFNSSETNQTYAFPRIGAADPFSAISSAQPHLESNADTVRRDSSTMIKASIYDSCEPVLPQKKTHASGTVDDRRQRNPTAKYVSTKGRPNDSAQVRGASGEGRRVINEDFYRQVQKLLRSGPLRKPTKSQGRVQGSPEKQDNNNKLSLYSTQRIVFDDVARKEFESYMGGTLPSQKLRQQLRHNAKSRDATALSKSRQQWEELPSVLCEEQSQTRKSHIRTQTMDHEGSRTKGTALKKIVYLKKLTAGANRSDGKSRSSSKAMQLSDYFSELISKRIKRVPNSKSVLRGTKTRTRAQMSNTFSLSMLNTTGQGMIRNSQRNTKSGSKVAANGKPANLRREATEL